MSRFQILCRISIRGETPMKAIAAALLIHAFASPSIFAGEPEGLNTSVDAVRVDQPLRRAIAMEASRLTRLLSVESAQAPAGADRRHWCRRHPIGCGALVGLPAGFLFGVASAGNKDFDPTGFGLFFGAPIGAG